MQHVAMLGQRSGPEIDATGVAAGIGWFAEPVSTNVRRTDLYADPSLPIGDYGFGAASGDDLAIYIGTAPTIGKAWEPSSSNPAERGLDQLSYDLYQSYSNPSSSLIERFLTRAADDIVNAPEILLTGETRIGAQRSPLERLALGASIIPAGRGLLAAKEGRVFWSGGSQTRVEAESFAKANGLKTLEIIWQGKALTRLRNFQTYKFDFLQVYSTLME